jgi:hypothetical protein
MDNQYPDRYAREQRHAEHHAPAGAPRVDRYLPEWIDNLKRYFRFRGCRETYRS